MGRTVPEGGVGPGWDCGLCSAGSGSAGGGELNAGWMGADLCFRRLSGCWAWWMVEEWKRGGCWEASAVRRGGRDTAGWCRGPSSLGGEPSRQRCH